MAQNDISWSHHLCSNLMPPLATQNRLICVATMVFLAYFGPFLVPVRPHFGTFLVLQMAQTGVSRCPYWCSNLLSPLPTQNRPSEHNCVAKRLFLVYFGPFLVPVRQHLGHFGCGKGPQLVCMDVFIDIPSFFQPFQPKIGLLSWFVWPAVYF